MSSIGLIFREYRDLESLPEDWVPQPLGSRQFVGQTLAECLAREVRSFNLSFRIEAVEESDEPRTISVSGVFVEDELVLIKCLCEKLDARFYDAESGDFVEI